jgi:uncharacterized protein
MVHFPVSGVEVNPLLPLFVAFLVSALTAPAGVSGAFLLLPFQVSALGFTSPAVSPPTSSTTSSPLRGASTAT